MLSKNDHIQYWLISSEEDWDRAMFMYERKDYVLWLFCIHLSIEKLSKAIWVKENRNSNYSPRIHDIKHLIADTSFVANAQQSLVIDDLQKYQIEGRYPDYKRMIVSYTNKEYADALLNGIRELRKYLLDKIS